MPADGWGSIPAGHELTSVSLHHVLVRMTECELNPTEPNSLKLSQLRRAVRVKLAADYANMLFDENEEENPMIQVAVPAVVDAQLCMHNYFCLNPLIPELLLLFVVPSLGPRALQRRRPRIANGS